MPALEASLSRWESAPVPLDAPRFLLSPDSCLESEGIAVFRVSGYLERDDIDIELL